MSTLDIALATAKAGFCVFPLNGKKPLMPEANWRKSATTDPGRIRSMWTCPVFDVPIDHNIGIALDANTLVVDVDVSDDKVGDKSLAYLEAINDPLPPTYEVRSASGGRHLYYKVPGISGKFPQELAKHIDLKREGGYVVAPGSTLNGRTYEPLREGPIGSFEMAPSWLCDYATAKRVAPDNRVAGESVGNVDSEYNVNRAIEWLTTAAPVAVEGGGGDNQTIAVVNHVGDLGISRDTAYELLLEHWNDDKAIPPWDPDDLRAKVASAYKSRQNAIGKADPTVELEPVEIEEKPKPKGRLFWKRFEDAAPHGVADELVQGWIDAGAMSVWYGNSNVGKTFVLLSISHAIGAGQAWNGCKTSPGLVVYVAAEGGHSIETRLMALKKELGDTRLAFIPCPVDLLHENADTKPLIKLIHEIAAAYDDKPKLIVIDTLSRALAGGNENASDDMGALVKNLDAIRAAFKAHVAIVHHKGKNEAAGARGHSLLRAATDTEVEITTGQIVATKQRDKEAAPAVSFRLRGLDVGQRPDGAAITSCVVDFTAAADFEDRITPGAANLYALLWKHAAKATKRKAAWVKENEEAQPVAADMAGVRISTREALDLVKKARVKGTSDSTVYGQIGELVGADLVLKNSDKSLSLSPTNPT